jgi:outer membrane protein assembly factor BamE (lipoprotein component of BamABCDE complex)
MARSLFAGFLLTVALLFTGCSGQRTLTTNAEGTRIDASVLDALRPGMTLEDWLVLHYGDPTSREPSTDGTVLTWTYSRYTHEHRPGSARRGVYAACARCARWQRPLHPRLVGGVE